MPKPLQSVQSPEPSSLPPSPPITAPTIGVQTHPGQTDYLLAQKITKQQQTIVQSAQDIRQNSTNHSSSQAILTFSSSC